MPSLFKPEPIMPLAGEAEWHARRKVCVGASEIATLFGCHPYLTPNHLYHIKRGTKMDERRGDKALRNFGNVMEPIIAQLVSDKTGWLLNDVKEHWIHPDHPYLGGTIDRFIVESERGPGILQIKNVSPFSPGWTDTRAADYVEYQVQQELMLGERLHGVKWACVGALVGGNPDDVRILIREPDYKVQEKMAKRAEKFWDMVENKMEPEIVSDDFDHVAGMFKAAEVREECVREATLEEQGLIFELSEARRLENEAKKNTEKAKAVILRAALHDMGEKFERDAVWVGEQQTLSLIHI